MNEVEFKIIRVPIATKCSGPQLLQSKPLIIPDYQGVAKDPFEGF